ncbi:hypothetical protein [Candidatus Nanohalococcus occultus]|uniref:hypothetical protein n=1 Tax=Candidatus Nanohalococcus occultus TaxID=2978047 RepID=UPI0039E06816
MDLDIIAENPELAIQTLTYGVAVGIGYTNRKMYNLRRRQQLPEDEPIEPTGLTQELVYSAIIGTIPDPFFSLYGRGTDYGLEDMGLTGAAAFTGLKTGQKIADYSDISKILEGEDIEIDNL